MLQIAWARFPFPVQNELYSSAVTVAMCESNMEKDGTSSVKQSENTTCYS